MADVITRAELESARVDVLDLGNIVNGAAHTAPIQTRLGQVVRPVARVIADAEAQLTAAYQQFEAESDAALAAAIDFITTSGPNPDTHEIPTRLIAQAANIPAQHTYIFVRGYSVPGDGGEVVFKKVVGEPAHPGKMQSADGAWWEMVGPRFRPQQFGGFPDGATNETVSISNAGLAAQALGGYVYLSRGLWRALGAVMPRGVDLHGDGRLRTIVRRIGVWNGNPIIRLGQEASSAVAASDQGMYDLTLDGSTDGTTATQLTDGVYTSSVLVGHLSRNVSVQRCGFKFGGGRWAARFQPALTGDRTMIGIEFTDNVFEDCPKGGFITLPAVNGNGNANVSRNKFYRVGANIVYLGDTQMTPYEARIACWINVHGDFNALFENANSGTDGPIPFEWWGCKGGTCNFNYIEGATRGLTAGAWMEDFEITGNLVKDQTAYFAESGPCRNVQVHHNIAINCSTFIRDTGNSQSVMERMQITDNLVIGTGLAAYNSGSPSDMIFLGNDGAHYVRGSTIARNRFFNLDYARTAIRLFATNPAPAVTFTGGGTGAIADVTYKGVRIRIADRGKLYTAAPIATVISRDGLGAGMTVSVTIDANGLIDGATVTAPGAGYKQSPQIILTGGGSRFPGRLEAVMGVDVVTPSGGTGYADGTFTVTSLTGGSNASGTFTQVGGVPNATVVTVPGEGFGTPSDFDVFDNEYYQNTFNSGVLFINLARGNFHVRKNKCVRTAGLTSAHHAPGTGMYSFAGQITPYNNPRTIIEENIAEMTGPITSGTIYGFGSNNAPFPWYGVEVLGNKARGNFSWPYMIQDSGGRTLFENNDIRDLTAFTTVNRTVYGQVRDEVPICLAPGQYLVSRDIYYDLTKLKPVGGRIVAICQMTGANQSIKIRSERTAGNLKPAMFEVSYITSLNNGAPIFGKTGIGFSSASLPLHPPGTWQVGTAVGIVSGDNGTGRMESTITLGGNQLCEAKIEAEFSRDVSLTDYSIRFNNS